MKEAKKEPSYQSCHPEKNTLDSKACKKTKAGQALYQQYKHEDINHRTWSVQCLSSNLNGVGVVSVYGVEKEERTAQSYNRGLENHHFFHC